MFDWFVVSEAVACASATWSAQFTETESNFSLISATCFSIFSLITIFSVSVVEMRLFSSTPVFNKLSFFLSNKSSINRLLKMILSSFAGLSTKPLPLKVILRKTLPIL